MSEIFAFLITLAAAIAGAYIFYRMHVPVGPLIGALLATAALSIFADIGTFPSIIKMGVQTITGAFIGLRIGKQDLKELRYTVKPAIMLLAGIMLMSLLSGALVARFSQVDLRTALMSTFPGGITEITIISMETGANTSQTALLQMFRVLVSVVLLPQCAIAICRHYKDPKAQGVALFGKSKDLQTAANM